MSYLYHEILRRLIVAIEAISGLVAKTRESIESHRASRIVRSLPANRSLEPIELPITFNLKKES